MLIDLDHAAADMVDSPPVGGDTQRIYPYRARETLPEVTTKLHGALEGALEAS